MDFSKLPITFDKFGICNTAIASFGTALLATVVLLGNCKKPAHIKKVNSAIRIIAPQSIDLFINVNVKVVGKKPSTKVNTFLVSANKIWALIAKPLSRSE